MTPEEIAALKAGDKITLEVGEVGKPGRARDGIWLLLAAGFETTFFTREELAHATLTPAPEPPLAVGDEVMLDGKRWEVAALPRVRIDGREWVSLWRDDSGFGNALVSSCTRVQS